MVMHNPPHPGEVIKELCIEPLGLTVTEAAKGLPFMAGLMLFSGPAISKSMFQIQVLK